MTETGDLDQGSVARGRALLAWSAGLVLALSLLTEAMGLKYVQNIVWPTDLFAFDAKGGAPIDVAIFGSSRASFAFSTSVIDRCLGPELRRPARTVNLARVYSTSLTWHTLARDLLDPDHVPRLLVLAIEAESVNSHHHYSESIFETEGAVRDVPDLLRSARGFRQGVAAMAPAVRGPLSMALLLSGRTALEARLRWMMLHEDGGQWCFDLPQCRAQNDAFEAVSSTRWARFVKNRDAIITDQRFTDYVIDEGLGDRRLRALLEWAESRGVALLFVNMPLHLDFQEKIPPAIYQAYVDYMNRISAAHGIAVYDGNFVEWRDDPEYFVDPDHLNHRGAKAFSREVCEKAIAPWFGERLKGG